MAFLAHNMSALALVGGAALCALSGCAASSSAGVPAAPVAAPRSAAVVFVTDPVLAWQYSAAGQADFERWEFARNNALLGARQRVPLLGSRQWPQPLPPPEAPVRFWLWEQ